MAVLFSSDHHFGHSNIIAFSSRSYDSVQEMNEKLILKWNETVMPSDLVYYLGDLCMGKLKETLPLIKRLQGEIILIPGNHDRCWFGRSAGETLRREREAYLRAGISEIIDTGAGHPEPTIAIGGVVAKMSHFPYIGDSHETKYSDKFSAWRPDDDGGWLIHGHIHNNAGLHCSPKVDHMLNVGVDVWDYSPVPMEWLAAMIAA